MKPSLYFRHKGATCVYHFTDEANLPLIRQTTALLSRVELERRRILVPKPGGNEWSASADAYRGLDRYVHLCLSNQHPMEYAARTEGRLERVKYLEVNLGILDNSDVRYTLGVSNKSGCQFLTFDEIAEQLDYEVLFTRTDWKDPVIKARLQNARKCEVLVPTAIEVGFIHNI